VALVMARVVTLLCWSLAGAVPVAAVVAFVVAEADRPVKQAALTKKCDDAERLMEIGLLGEARAEYRTIRRAAGPSACGEKSKLDDIPGRQRRRARTLERARTYRRAAGLRRPSALVKGRRTAQRRAHYAYLVALRIDPFAREGRRGLRAILGKTPPPVKGSDANALCASGAEIAEAGLAPEARLYFAKALRTGRTTRCAQAARRGSGAVVRSNISRRDALPSAASETPTLAGPT